MITDPQDSENDKIIEETPKTLTLSEQDRIKILVVHVCEDVPENFAKNIQKLTDLIIQYSQNTQKQVQKETLIKYFIESISLLNFKQSIYATVLSLVYIQSKQSFQEIFKCITDQLQKHLNQGCRIQAKNVLIFLGELMNIGVVNCYNYLKLLNQILEQSKKDTSDYYLSILIGSLVYVMDSLKQKIEVEFEQLVEEIEKIMKKRNTSYIQLLKNKYNKHKDLDRIQLQWLYLVRDVENGVQVNTFRPQKLFENSLSKIEQPEVEFNLDFSAKNTELCQYQSNLFISCLLKNEDDIETGQLQLNSERIMLYENIIQTIDLFSDSKKILIQQLQTLKKMLQNPELYPLFIDILLSESLRTPKNSKIANIFYSSVCISLFLTNKDDTNKQVFASFLEYYVHIDQYCVESMEGLADFMSHYASNINFEFDWKQIVIKNTCQSDFLKEMFKKIINFNNQDKLEENFKELEQFKPFIHKQQIKEIVKQQYQDKEIYQKIMEKLVQKKNSSEMLEFLNTFSNQQEAAKIFLECLFFRSCETFTHLKLLYERYNVMLKSLNQQIVHFYKYIINTLLHFWQNSEFHLNIYLQIFINNEFIKHIQIIEVIFTNLAESTSQFRTNQLWLFMRKCVQNAGNSQEILNYIFNQFLSIFEEEEKEEIKNKMYNEYFIYFVRQFKSKIEWKKKFEQQFSELSHIIPFDIISAFNQ